MWDRLVPSIVAAWNSHRCRDTGLTPNELVFSYHIVWSPRNVNKDDLYRINKRETDVVADVRESLRIHTADIISKKKIERNITRHVSKQKIKEGIIIHTKLATLY